MDIQYETRGLLTNGGNISMNPYLLIDSNNLCHIAHYATGNLSNEEKRVGVLFGFLKKILSLSKTLNSNKFIFCFDSKKSYRKQIYPKYKANRNKKLSDEEINERHFLYDQIDELKNELLPSMGFKNIFCKPGYESDDLLAWLSEHIDGDKIIVSTDSDLFQLLKFVLYIFNPIKNTKYTQQNFFAEYGMDCSRWGEVKAVVGCNSDNVDGVNGVGNKTAIKFLCGAILHGSPQWEKITSNYDKINFNKRLVCLPFKGHSNLSCKLNEDVLKKKNFIEVFNKLNFNSFLKQDVLNSWIKCFDLK